MSDKQKNINWESLSNKKQLFSTNTKQAQERMKSVTGTQLLKKIGQSSEEMQDFLKATTKNYDSLQLPPYNYVCIEQLSNVILGLQQCQTEREANRVRLEHINELSKEKARPYLANKPEILRLLPPRQTKNENGIKVLRLPHRTFLFTVFKLADPEGFEEFVKNARVNNSGRIKAKEKSDFKILDSFYEKAQEYEKTNQKKGTMPASIINKQNKVENKRKRAVEKGRDPDNADQSSDEVYQPEDLDEDELRQDPKEQHEEGGSKADLQESLDQKTKALKQLEVKLQRKAFDQTKNIEDDEERKEAYDQIAEELERDFVEFSLKIPTYDEAIYNQDTD